MRLSLGNHKRRVSLVLVSALLLSMMSLTQFVALVSAEPVHDVAVLSVTPECTEAYVTWTRPLKVEVAVENQGSEAENFSVTLWYINGTRGTIASKNASLAAGENTTVTFNWAIGARNWRFYPRWGWTDWDCEAEYWVDKYRLYANVSVVSGETDVDDNTLIGPVFTLKFVGDANGDGFVGGYDATLSSLFWWQNVPKP